MFFVISSRFVLWLFALLLLLFVRVCVCIRLVLVGVCVGSLYLFDLLVWQCRFFDMFISRMCVRCVLCYCVCLVVLDGCVYCVFVWQSLFCLLSGSLLFCVCLSVCLFAFVRMWL